MLLCHALALVSLAGLASGARPVGDDEQYFETNVRPLLVQHCFGCHSDAAPKVKGGLKLDSRAALQAGGASGAVVVPGDPVASELIAVLRYDGLVQMPPKGKLAPADIATLEEWVRRGAYFPDDGAVIQNSDAAARALPWSFEPVRRVQAPEVRDELWCRNDIDRFVLARLEGAGLAPAAEASRAVLARRASEILTGLPADP
ncbi:MAG: c-type cytochrome domain-containing protein, partial [Planctomycetota bacterium]